MDANRLYFVSLGPGEAEMITVAGLEALMGVDAICIPTKSEDRSFTRSMTHSIVTKLMDKFNFQKPLIPIYTPMLYKDEDWKAQVDEIYKALKSYHKVALVTLGDAGVYSTVYYLLDIIKNGDAKLYEASKVIPGITSFSYASAKVKKPLCIGESEMKISLLPKRNVPVTTIYMRPHIGMDTAEIEQKGKIYTFEKLCFEDEKIYIQKPKKIKGYMTLIIDFIFKKGNS